MKQNKILSYSLDLALSNEFYDAILHCLEHELFNEKVEV